MRKVFFRNNKLNKGYNNITSRELPNISNSVCKKPLFRKKDNLSSFLPDPSIMAFYEEIYPGSTKILFDMAYKEQKQIHQISSKKIQLQNRALSLCKIFFFFVLIINLFTFIMMYKMSINVNHCIIVWFVFSVLIVLVILFTFKKFKLSAIDKKAKNMKH